MDIKINLHVSIIVGTIILSCIVDSYLISSIERPLLTSFTRLCNSSCVFAQQTRCPDSSVLVWNSTKFQMSSSLCREMSLQGRQSFSGCGTSCRSFLSFCHTITTVKTITSNRTFKMIITTARFRHRAFSSVGVSFFLDPFVFSEPSINDFESSMFLSESIVTHTQAIKKNLGHHA